MGASLNGIGNIGSPGGQRAQKCCQNLLNAKPISATLIAHPTGELSWRIRKCRTFPAQE
jgi:hypothetical protein